MRAKLNNRLSAGYNPRKENQNTPRNRVVLEFGTQVDLKQVGTINLIRLPAP